VRFITAQLSKYEEKENTVWFLVLCWKSVQKQPK
jgi:hypothetical protein